MSRCTNSLSRAWPKGPSRVVRHELGLHAAIDQLVVVGVDWQTAGDGELQQVSSRAQALGSEVSRLVEQRVLLEALVISTCNRLEIVGISGPTRDRAVADEVLERLGNVLGSAQRRSIQRRSISWRRRGGLEALRHLFRLACGLESALLGERDVRGQLRSAVRLAQSSGTCGPLLGRIVESALGAAQNAHSATSIGAGRSSLADLAATEVLDWLDGEAGQEPQEGKIPVLLVGAGPMIDKCARRLAAAGSRLLFANRTLERARALAARHDGVVVGWPGFGGAKVGAVVIATSSPVTLLGEPQLEQLFDRGSGARWHGLIVDLGMPADVDEDAATGTGLRYVGVGQLTAAAAATTLRREASLSAASGVLERELERFLGAARRQRAEPWVSALQKRYRETAVQALVELEGLLPGTGSRAAGGDRVGRRELERTLDQWAARLARRLAHEPSRILRALAERDHVEVLEEILEQRDGNGTTAQEVPHAVSS